MKKKRFPPPPEIVQRTRCYLALRVLRAYVDVMGQTSDRRFDDLMDTIRRWLVECEALLERRPVSNRTDSEVIEKLRILLSCTDCGPQKSPREQYTHWGAAIFCAHVLLVDVRATCPAWYGKPIRRRNAAGAITSRYPWRYLCGAVQRLAEGLEATIPETGALGTKIYMQITE